jgi:membrane fusion protein, heavy metal efflux system
MSSSQTNNTSTKEHERDPRPPATDETRIVRPRRRWLVVLAILIIGSGVVAFFLMSRATSSSEAGKPVPEPSLRADASGSLPGEGEPRTGDLRITLASDQLTNADIQTEPAVESANSGTAPGLLRTTATVQSNAYKEVGVAAIAGGVVRQVKVELGDRVTRGQPLAVIFSTELSEAEATFVRMLAEIEKHHKHFRRTQELFELGAVSREEMETATAEFKTEEANIAQMKQRLLLLGLTDKQVESLSSAEQVKSLITVESPAAGLVVTRSVNGGEVVMAGKELVRVTDLSTVWVIGQIYERDFSVVKVGTPAVITTQAYPGRTFKARVAYIDPRIDPQTRTAQVRMEIANPGEMLRLGMFVDVSFGEAAPSTVEGPALAVPASAIQAIGSRQVVYVVGNEPGVFFQRDVNVKSGEGGKALVYGGLSPGERVVTQGSFFLRSESLKVKPDQTLEKSAAAVTQGDSQTEHDNSKGEPSVQTARVEVTEEGFKPDTIKLRAGVPARITFLRKAEVTCATEVLIPDFDIKRELPVNEPVVVELKPAKRGEFPFTCGMKMLRGKIVVR